MQAQTSFYRGLRQGFSVRGSRINTGDAYLLHSYD